MKNVNSLNLVRPSRRLGLVFRLVSALIWCGLAMFATKSSAADDLVIDTFDTADTAAGWAKWWGAAPQTYEWDGTVDANDNGASGSLKVTVAFDQLAYTGDNQFAALRNFAAAIDGSQYASITMDILWEPNSPQRPLSHDFGWLEGGFRNADYSVNSLLAQSVLTTPGWIHITMPINPNADKITTVSGVMLKMWAGSDTDGLTGTAIFWVDNVKLIAKTSNQPEPVVIDTFDTEPTALGWSKWWGAAPQTYTWDGAMDADGNAASGALKVTVDFDVAAYGGDNQFSALRNYPIGDGRTYQSVILDIYWDASSPKRPLSNDYGYLEPGLRNEDYSFNALLAGSVTQAGQWVHLILPINPESTGIETTAGIALKMWAGSSTDGLTGKATFWVDNVKLVPKPTAPEPVVLSKFDTADQVSNWSRWWGAASQLYEWDGTVDAGDDASSGSLKVTVGFDLAAHGGDNQFAAIGSFPQFDGSQYTNLVFDLLWDPASPERPVSHDFGYMEPGFRNSGFGTIGLPGFSVTTEAGWKHITLPINPNADTINAVTGVLLKIWAGSDTDGLTGTATFWVDNIQLIPRTDLQNPPPQLFIEKPKPGLRVFASSPGNQFQRQAIRTAATTYSWVNAVDPVTYSITISEYPNSPVPLSIPTWKVHLYLVPASAPLLNEVTPDWDQPTIVIMDIQRGTNNTPSGGPPYAWFRYKYNEPSGNNFLYDTNGTGGSTAFVQSSVMEGTWNLTFNPGGQITMSAPDGSSVNTSLPQEVVDVFNGPVYAYFGIQPCELGNYGLSATISRLQITGVTTPIDETFDSATLNPIWQIRAADPAGVTVVAPDTLFSLSWTLPDTGYSLKVSDDLNTGVWQSFAPTGVGKIGDLRRTNARAAELPASASGNYFIHLQK